MSLQEDKEWGFSGYDEDPEDGKTITCPLCGEWGGVRSDFIDCPCEDCDEDIKRGMRDDDEE